MPKKSTKRTHLRTTEETRYNICEDYFARFMTVKKICQKYRMADTTVRGILERNRVEDRIAYKSRGGARNTTQFKQEHTHFIRDMMDMEDEQNIVSLEEIQKKLLERFPNDFFVASSSSSSSSASSASSSSSSSSVTPTLSALQRHIDKNLQLTMKRVMSPLPADVNISHIHQQRLAYCNHLQANQFDYLTNCIFIGESEFNVCMVPARLRLKRGKKSDAMLSKTRRGKTISILGAISSNRIECLQAIVVDRPSDQAMYEDFMTELIKKLDKEYTSQNFVFIIDSHVFQRSPKMHTLLTTTSTIHHHYILLPLYSRLLSPIEPCFQSLKNFICRSPSAQKEDLFQLIKNAENNISKETCTSWTQESLDHLKKCLQGESIIIT